MASLIRGTTITPSTLVTAATLHALIEQATLVGITGTDFSGGFTIATSSATPNASLAPYWFDPHMDDPVFRVFATPWNIWLAVGPDRFEIPFRNASGTDCLKGALVVASGASEFTIATSPSLNAIGFLQAPTAAGSFGPVATVGIGWALYCSSVSIGTPAGGNPDEQHAVVARGCRPGTVAGYSIDGAEGSGPMFGMWLESDRSGASGSMSPKRIRIWGPRLTTGF